MPIIDILIALGYLIILILCMITAFYANTAVSTNHILYHRIIFISITVLLIIMLTSRLLDFNVYLTETGRMIARSGGWYENRRFIQMLFVTGIFISAIISFMLMERKLDTIWQCYSKTFYGIIFLLGFIIINTASYHPVDQLLKIEFGGIKYSRFIEFFSIAWIALSLLFCNRRRSRLKTREYKPPPGSKFV